jgi:hypothetical protein
MAICFCKSRLDETKETFSFANEPVSCSDQRSSRRAELVSDGTSIRWRHLVGADSCNFRSSYVSGIVEGRKLCAFEALHHSIWPGTCRSCETIPCDVVMTTDTKNTSESRAVCRAGHALARARPRQTPCRAQVWPVRGRALPLRPTRSENSKNCTSFEIVPSGSNAGRAIATACTASIAAKKPHAAVARAEVLVPEQLNTLTPCCSDRPAESLRGGNYAFLIRYIALHCRIQVTASSNNLRRANRANDRNACIMLSSGRSYASACTARWKTPCCSRERLRRGLFGPALPAR